MSRQTQYEKEQRAIETSLRKISELISLPLEEVYGRTYCLVTEESHKLFKRVGIHHSSDNLCTKFYCKFKKISKPVEFQRSQIFLTNNPIMLIEEQDKLYQLFQD